MKTIRLSHKSIILKSSVIRVLNVQQDKVGEGGIRLFHSYKQQNYTLHSLGTT